MPSIRSFLLKSFPCWFSTLNRSIIFGHRRRKGMRTEGFGYASVVMEWWEPTKFVKKNFKSYKPNMEHGEMLKRGCHSHITEDSKGYVYSGNIKEMMTAARGLLQSQKGAFMAVTGERSSGKSAFIAEFLRGRVNPVVRISACELKNYGINQLTKLLRRAVQVTFTEQFKLVEGEVLEITSSKLVLKTVDIKSVFEIGVKIKQELDRERVEVGDIIRIYKDSGFVTKLGRSTLNNAEDGDGLTPVVDVPEGECFKTEPVSTVLSLDELDTINFTENGEELIFTETYAPKNIRAEVDKKVYTWIREGKAIYDKGVVIVDGADGLSDSIFDTLQSCKHSEYYPLVIFTGLSVSERIKQYSFTISVSLPSQEDASKILCSRANYLGVNVDVQGMEKLLTIFKTKGLKAALHIMHVSVRLGAVSSANVDGMLGIFGFGCS